MAVVPGAVGASKPRTMPEMPQAGAQPGSQPQQPPFGSTSATGPTENKGYEAAGLQRLGVTIKALEALIPMLGSASDAGKDVLKALNLLVKHVPSGSVTPAAEKRSLEEAQMRNTQNNQQMQALMQQRKQQSMGGGQQPGQGQGAMAA